MYQKVRDVSVAHPEQRDSLNYMTLDLRQTGAIYKTNSHGTTTKNII